MVDIFTGRTPFFVSATAGTTVMGGFDPLDSIADVCEKHGLWMHVDGSWGGSGENFFIVFPASSFGWSVVGAYFCLHCLKQQPHAVAMSEKHRGLLKGLERSDSMAWNPHKVLFVKEYLSAISYQKTKSRILFRSAFLLHVTCFEFFCWFQVC